MMFALSLGGATSRGSSVARIFTYVASSASLPSIVTLGPAAGSALPSPVPSPPPPSPSAPAPIPSSLSASFSSSRYAWALPGSTTLCARRW